MTLTLSADVFALSLCPTLKPRTWSHVDQHEGTTKLYHLLDHRQKQLCNAAYKTHTYIYSYLQVGLFIRVDLDPMTMRPRRARVSATLSRRTSAKNPILPCALERTALKIMTSLSCPAVTPRSLVYLVCSTCITILQCYNNIDTFLTRSSFSISASTVQDILHLWRLGNWAWDAAIQIHS